MEMSTQLLLTRIEQNKDSQARDKADHGHRQVCAQRDMLLDKLDSMHVELQQAESQNTQYRQIIR